VMSAFLRLELFGRIDADRKLVELPPLWIASSEKLPNHTVDVG
jgi:hypothetical protein